MSPLPANGHSVLDAQAESGAFLSTVHLDGKPVPDENGFVTALIVHELSRCREQTRVQEAIERALGFLLRCELRDRPGHFCFYPENAHPDWMNVRLTPDADDTALLAPLLVRYGCRPASLLKHVIEKVLDPHRLLYLAEWSEPWYRVGAYFTWLKAGYPRNVVDCCVNVNALSLIKQSDITDPAGFAEIVSMVDRAISWAGNSEERARMLSPWYPHPVELMYAVQRAVSSGVGELDAALSKIRSAPWSRVAELSAAKTPVCGSIDRRIIWTCPALHAARSLNDALVVP